MHDSLCFACMKKIMDHLFTAMCSRIIIHQQIWHLHAACVVPDTVVHENSSSLLIRGNVSGGLSTNSYVNHIVNCLHWTGNNPVQWVPRRHSTHLLKIHNISKLSLCNPASANPSRHSASDGFMCRCLAALEGFALGAMCWH